MTNDGDINSKKERKEIDLSGDHWNLDITVSGRETSFRDEFEGDKVRVDYDGDEVGVFVNDMLRMEVELPEASVQALFPQEAETTGESIDVGGLTDAFQEKLATLIVHGEATQLSSPDEVEEANPGHNAIAAWLQGVVENNQPISADEVRESIVRINNEYHTFQPTEIDALVHVLVQQLQASGLLFKEHLEGAYPKRDEENDTIDGEFTVVHKNEEV